MRSVIGTDIPLAIDHIGHIGVNECIKLAKRIEKYNIAWMEDALPWQYTELYRRLQNAVNIPICTGEDIYLHENFKPLLEAGGVSVCIRISLHQAAFWKPKKLAIWLRNMCGNGSPYGRKPHRVSGCSAYGNGDGEFFGTGISLQ